MIEYFKTFCMFFFFIMIGVVAWKEYKPAPITQEWIKEDVVCYMQGERVVNCETVRLFE